MSCQVLNKMRKFNESVKINYNPNWVYIPDHRYEILFMGDSGSEKINVLLNLINL